MTTGDRLLQPGEPSTGGCLAMVGTLLLGIALAAAGTYALLRAVWVSLRR